MNWRTGFGTAACFIAAMCGAVSDAAAGTLPDYPSFATVQSDTDPSFTRIVCEIIPDTSMRIRCQFTQLLFTNVRKETEREEYLKRSAREFLNGALGKIEFPFGDCAAIEGFLHIFKNSSSSKLPSFSDQEWKETQTKIATIGEVEQRDIIELFESMRGFCEEPDLSKALELAGVMFDKDLRTCEVHINHYTLEFAYSGKNWISNSGPSGLCGVVQLTIIEGKDSLWSMRTRKTVTNRSQDLCKSVSEREIHATWKPREIAISCDYIIP